MTGNGDKRATLVVGGTGKTGRRVAERLRARDLPVLVGSRSGAPPFDWDDPGTWAAALRGADSVYVTYYPDLAFPGAADAIRDFSRLAVESGARRLVLLSGRGEPEAQAAERELRESGAEWTILRAAFFFQNFSEHFLLGPVLDGEIAMPAGDVAEPFVDAEDVADVAVAALTDDRHIGEVYELTGPRLLTFADAAAEIGEAAGRDIAYVPVSAEEYATALAEHMPADEARLLTDLFASVLDGRNAHLSDGVRRALGRPPRDFADFAPDTAATGVWEA
ncbi:NAD(P)H-binding protein [Planotetraspora mira]|uniref:NAD(P)H-binding protein n=1 Tax=Planotetraspora mira TaxID=58121 RepID=UPI00194F9132|nr:NAD(P)H-binding protein [Planotetraspora mira]